MEVSLHEWHPSSMSDPLRKKPTVAAPRFSLLVWMAQTLLIVTCACEQNRR